MVGNQTWFARQDYVEEAWRILEPVLNNPPPVQVYEPGTWGPEAAAKLTAEQGGWWDPKPESRNERCFGSAEDAALRSSRTSSAEHLQDDDRLRSAKADRFRFVDRRAGNLQPCAVQLLFGGLLEAADDIVLSRRASDDRQVKRYFAERVGDEGVCRQHCLGRDRRRDEPDLGGGWAGGG